VRVIEESSLPDQTKAHLIDIFRAGGNRTVLNHQATEAAGS
jgi:hypothetical protein